MIYYSNEEQHYSPTFLLQTISASLHFGQNQRSADTYHDVSMLNSII